MQLTAAKLHRTSALVAAIFWVGCATSGPPSSPLVQPRRLQPIDPQHWQALAAANSAEEPFCSLDRHPLRPISPTFFGISAKEIHWDTPQLDLVAERLREAGAYYVGTKVHWEVLEEQPGNWQWHKYDPHFAAYGRHGLHPVVTLRGTPEWASSGDDPEHPERYPARDLEHWRRFVAAAVNRWGTAGSDLVHDWEIWNEPNLGSSFQGTPRQYLQLLEVANEEIHRSDPAARVWAPALMFHPWSRNADSWLVQVTAEGHFDVLSIHLYFNDLVAMRRVVHRARRLLDQADKSTVPLAVSETHVIDSVTRCPRLGAMAEEIHTQIVSDLLICLANAGVEHLLYFKATDLNFNCRAPDDELPNRIGLLDQDLVPKARWHRFRDLALRGDPTIPLLMNRSAADDLPLFADGFESGDTTAWERRQQGEEPF